MVKRLRVLWQLIRKHRSFVIYFVVMIVFVIAFFIVAQLIFLGYGPDWTGFNGYNKVTTAHTISGPNAGATIQTEEYQPGKALWDWLQLLIIPAALAITALWFNRSTTRTEQSIAAKRFDQEQQIAADRYKQDQEIANKRYEQEQKIALDKQREDLLQIYLDRMSDLLLKEKLRSSAIDDEVRNVARVRTITILFQLDARRIGYVFAFLRESGLMSTETNNSIVSFDGAGLSNINFSHADLSKANLSGADLSKANLSNAFLYKTNFSGANLYEANFSEAELVEANLDGATLCGANFNEAELHGADLIGTNLIDVNFSGANLAFVDLTGSIGITIEELEKQANELLCATLPNGSTYRIKTQPTPYLRS